MRLYNTLTRQVEPVEPLEPGHLRFYTCGPTVYSYAHIGNFRSFLTADLILRTAEAIGWRTTFVTNITDVGHLTQDDVADAGGEDRMTMALRSPEGGRFANVWDLARYYTETMLEDWRALNLREPAVRPRATEHVAQQIRTIERLIETGHAYETSLGVYFSVPSFPAYGKLSGNVEAERLEGARDVVRDPEKRDPRDFALWKRDPTHLMQWHSPWGWGFPGWHIECSVMSAIYLGEQFDLHTGGEDNKFPHHECEIAQSESLLGRQWVRYWVHTRFLEVEGEKMAKSRGNFYTVRDLIAPEQEGGRGVDPLALRLALISGHYRNPFNFTFDTLRASVRHVQRFQAAWEKGVRALSRGEAAEGAAAGQAPQAGAAGQPAQAERAAAQAERAPQAEQGARAGDDRLAAPLDALYTKALDAMLDDLNTPAALAAALEGARLIHGAGDPLSAASARSAKRWLDKINALLGIVRPEADIAEPPRASAADPLAERVEALLAERAEARRARDFGRADAIRETLEAMGVEVMDSSAGTSWRRRANIEA